MSRQVVTLLFLAALAVTASAAASAHRDPRAEELARATMDAMGGEGAFSGARILRFDFQVERNGQPASLYHHWWDRATGDYRLEGVTEEGAPFRVLFNVGSRRGQVWVGSELLGDEAAAPHLERAYGRFINDSYWLLMPWKWLDPGVHLDWEGERQEDGRLYDVVRLTFEEKTGLTSNDRYWAYVARDSGLMERWAYVLEGEDGRPGSDPPTDWAWEEWKETQAGIRLSTVKRRLGEGPPLAISFPVAEAFRELSPDAMAAAFRPAAPVAPPAAASGTAPAAAGLSRALAVPNTSEHAVALVDPETLAVLQRGRGTR